MEMLLENDIITAEVIKNVDAIIEEIDKKLQVVDHKGSFSSDDEIGWFFTDVKRLFVILQDYKNIE